MMEIRLAARASALRSVAVRAMQSVFVSAVVFALGTCAQAQTAVVGGSDSQPVDITAHIVANDNLVLSGGSFVIKIPVAGSSGVSTSKVIRYALEAGFTHPYNYAFVDDATPAVLYTGVLSGTGKIILTNATSTTPTSTLNVNGGLLIVGSTFQFASASGPTLAIEANTAIEFVDGSSGFSTSGLSVTNDGLLGSHVGYRWGSITGSGSATFGHDYATGEDLLTGNSNYSGRVFVMWGTHIATNAKLDPTLALWQQGIASFETTTGSLVKRTAMPHIDTFAGPYYSAGPDTQIQRWGVQQFTGEGFLIPGVTDPSLLSMTESRQFNYMYNIRLQKGRTFYVIGTLLMGDGSPIVNRDDGSNNTFLQGNVYGQNVLIEVGQWETAPTSLASLKSAETVAFNYSGKYSFNGNINLNLDSNFNIIGDLGWGWGNIVVMDPDPNNTGKAANHLVLTQPVFTKGYIQIEKNAILQLGDGTKGNDSEKTVVVKGLTYSGRSSSSWGNGMVLTKGNTPSSFTSASISFYSIDNEGRLIVNNVPDAMNITRTGGDVTGLMKANELDGISGSGSVEQIGTLALTLGSSSGNDNTYTGGTMIRSGATLIVGSAKALGTHDASLTTATGNVLNNGTLQTASGVRTITVPGDYSQVAAAADAVANNFPQPDKENGGEFASAAAFLIPRPALMGVRREMA